jgi:hypothetical protein
VSPSLSLPRAARVSHRRVVRATCPCCTEPRAAPLLSMPRITLSTPSFLPPWTHPYAYSIVVLPLSLLARAKRSIAGRRRTVAPPLRPVHKMAARRCSPACHSTVLLKTRCSLSSFSVGRHCRSCRSSLLVPSSSPAVPFVLPRAEQHALAGHLHPRASRAARCSPSADQVTAPASRPLPRQATSSWTLPSISSAPMTTPVCCSVGRAPEPPNYLRPSVLQPSPSIC